MRLFKAIVQEFCAWEKERMCSLKTSVAFTKRHQLRKNPLSLKPVSL